MDCQNLTNAKHQKKEECEKLNKCLKNPQEFQKQKNTWNSIIKFLDEKVLRNGPYYMVILALIMIGYGYYMVR